MFVGYALIHEGNVYIMWDPSTRGIHFSRDITWLKRIFFEIIVHMNNIQVRTY